MCVLAKFDKEKYRHREEDIFVFCYNIIAERVRMVYYNHDHLATQKFHFTVSIMNPNNVRVEIHCR